MIHKSITTRGYLNKYKTFTKSFEDERHFSNWYKKVTAGDAYGTKIVGVEDLEIMTDEDYRTELVAKGWSEADILQAIERKREDGF